ncbi:hypothetical protein [Paracoccus aestuariivivens]|uniref:hypothetical protein n=1 Tax=Paracoccus aestuariivivens TaxID=1820333 RepID=UPI0014782727|nr:hypothetical protein [Paracoccus aestuariivivens]
MSSWTSFGRSDVTTALLFVHAGSDLEAISRDLAARNVELIENGEQALFALCAASSTLRDFEPLRTERLTAITGTDPTLPWFGAAITDPNRLSDDLAQIVGAHFISPVTAKARRRAIFITQPFWERNKIMDFAGLMTAGSPGTLLVPVLEPRPAAVARFSKKMGWDHEASQRSVEVLENQALRLTDAFPTQTVVWDRGMGPEGIDPVFAAEQEEI